MSEENDQSLLDLIQGKVQEIRESSGSQKLDNFIEALDGFLGASGKAWLANGLDELRQAASLGTEQVQDGNQPGIWGTSLPREAFDDRQATEAMSLDDLRGYAEEKAKAAEQQMDGGMNRDHGMEM